MATYSWDTCKFAKSLINFNLGVSMVIGILCFPAGWDHEQVRGICGKESNDYALGLCGIRWAFVMAFICVIDAFILSILAVVLSKRKVAPLPPHVSTNNIYKGMFF